MKTGGDGASCSGSRGSRGCSLELEDQSAVGLVRHAIGASADVVASIDAGQEQEVAAKPHGFFSNAATDRRVRDRQKLELAPMQRIVQRTRVGIVLFGGKTLTMIFSRQSCCRCPFGLLRQCDRGEHVGPVRH
jgi:hypothetical protein